MTPAWLRSPHWPRVGLRMRSEASNSHFLSQFSALTWDIGCWSLLALRARQLVYSSIARKPCTTAAWGNPCSPFCLKTETHT